MSDATADMSLQESCIDAARHLSVEVHLLASKADELERENAKLRELVVEVFGCARRRESCETCKANNDGYACVYIMRELGVEVDK